MIIGAAALFGAGVGVKKGLDAKEDFDRAERITNDARNTFDKAKDALERTRKDTREGLEKLGETKLDIYQNGLKPFVDALNKIKNIDFTDPNLAIDPNMIFNQNELREIRDISLKIADILAGGVTSLAGGALAGIGAFGGAGLLATASTGTAISTLSGVAATNATLAWFGGGALAAGGFGMAGGMAVLGGLVASPVLLVGGFLMASKAEQAVEDAYSNYEKAKASAEALETARTAARAIMKRVDEIHDVLQELKIPFMDTVEDLVNLVSEKTDYREYSKRECELVGVSSAFAVTVKKLLEVPVFDEDGAITAESKKMLKTASNFLYKLKAV